MWHSFQGMTLTLWLDAPLERIFSFFPLLSPIPRELIQHSNFHEAFPDLAAQETRTITTLASAYLPAGSYTFIEMYCDEPHCDCRRVFFSVLSSNTLQIETVIAYGWE